MPKPRDRSQFKIERSDTTKSNNVSYQRYVRTRERAPNSDGATNHTAARKVRQTQSLTKFQINVTCAHENVLPIQMERPIPIQIERSDKNDAVVGKRPINIGWGMLKREAIAVEDRRSATTCARQRKRHARKMLGRRYDRIRHK